MATNGVCPFVLTRKLLLHVLLTLVLITVQTTQGIILDTFLISAEPTSLVPYFWIISDFFVVFCFGVTMCRSYSHWKKASGLNIRQKSNTKLAEQRRRPSFFVKYFSVLGYHPLCYIAWFIYSVILVIKVAVIFKLDIINKVKPDSFLGPQLMKMSIGLTAAVFFLFVEGHYDAARDSKQGLYISSLVKSTAFEIFDSITFISLLIVSENSMMYSYTFQNVIIAFACINLLLPNFCFYKLSQNDYGRQTTSAVLSFTYKMLHLMLVNIPYMVVRIYMWVMMDAEVSIFLIKNVLHIILALLDCKGESIIIVRALRARLGYRAPVSSDEADSKPSTAAADHDARNNIHLDNFVEVDLRGKHASNETSRSAV